MAALRRLSHSALRLNLPFLTYGRGLRGRGRHDGRRHPRRDGMGGRVLHVAWRDGHASGHADPADRVQLKGLTAQLLLGGDGQARQLAAAPQLFQRVDQMIHIFLKEEASTLRKMVDVHHLSVFLI